MDITPAFFKDLKLSPQLVEALNQAGLNHPTPIQEQSIPVAQANHDVIGCAQTGTGKTLAFCLPLIEKLQNCSHTTALILSPTREIAEQTFEVLKKFGSALKVTATVLIGGKNINTQASQLQKQPNIVVATPGRLLDQARRKNINLRKIENLVLDEADHMLDLGFLPQVQEILRLLPAKRQTLMFSATFPSAIERLAQRFMHQPKRIEIAKPGTAAQGIDHSLFLLEPHHKRKAIMTLLKDVHESTLVFTRTKLDAQWLYRLLVSEGQKAHALHSDRSQGQRSKTLQEFKQGLFPILVATDILARGIDIEGVAHVINYDIPQNPEDYIHRAGRTARAQSTGSASILATWMEMSFVQAIETQLGFALPRKTIPGIPAYEEIKSQNIGRGRLGKRVRLR